MHATPYHAGELLVQQRTGEAAPASLNGRNIAPHVPAPARGFVTQQNMVLLGTADSRSRLWATLVTGRPGFASVSDSLTDVRLELEDREGVFDLAPSIKDLRATDPIAMLFIELSTRRRLRVNGTLTAAGAKALEMHVAQAYAACPKYIQRRTPAGQISVPALEAASGTAFTDALKSIIERADTLFVASAGPDGLLDVSHRGGRTGFAEFRNGTLHIPDYAGNSMFNTLGNLELDNRAGLCIPDFEHSCQWLLSGRAQGRYEVPGSDDKTGGTLRWVEFVPAEWTRLPLNVARVWTFVDSSPFNA
jgi:uncharacterized protein